MQNVSSEQELRKLLEEGKITQAEYDELEKAIKTTSPTNIESLLSQNDKLKPKRKLGIIAFVLMLSGVILPIVGFIILNLLIKSQDSYSFATIAPWFFLGVILEIAAFGTGIASWRDPFGKAATIVSFLLLVFTVLFILFCSVHIVKVVEPIEAGELNELKHFSLDSVDGIITQSGVEIDSQISSDGNGSLKIIATEPTVVRLFETGDIDVENTRLIYQAKVRTENVEGQVYLEMWCHLSGLGDYFSRGLDRPLTGTTDWVTEETPFFLQVGQNPDNIKLNLVINGKGTAWIDDIRLYRGPLK